jgi:hypothetical protein
MGLLPLITQFLLSGRRKEQKEEQKVKPQETRKEATK